MPDGFWRKPKPVAILYTVNTAEYTSEWLLIFLYFFSCTLQGDATRDNISILSLSITRSHTHTHIRNKLTLYVENCAILGYYTVSNGNSLAMFLDTLSVPLSRIKIPIKESHCYTMGYTNLETIVKKLWFLIKFVCGN
jgi:hypothetical protein